MEGGLTITGCCWGGSSFNNSDGCISSLCDKLCCSIKSVSKLLITLSSCSVLFSIDLSFSEKVITGM